MNTKLTITLEKEIIERTKAYAAETGSSLSKMVENYFRSILDENDKSPSLKSNKVKKLRGIVSLDENIDYKSVIEEEVNGRFSR